MAHNKNIKYLYIEGIRAIAAIYVMMHHIMLSFKFQALSPVNQFFTDIFKYGHYAVDVFIVISGFCLTLPLLDNNYALPIFKFYKRRFIRIYPTYLISCIISLLLIVFLIGNKTGTLWDLSFPITREAIITHILLVQDFFYDTISRLNYILWSVSVEGRIYLIFPLLLLITRRWSIFTTFFSAFIISALMWLLLMYAYKQDPQINVSAAGVHPYIILFASGMLAADISCRMSTLKLPWILMLVAFIIIQVILENAYHGSTIKDINVGFCASSLLIAIEKTRNNNYNLNWLERFFSGKFIVFLGSYSYSIYLFHPFLIQLLWQFTVNPLHLTALASYYLLLLAGTPIILTVSYGMFILFEKPFLKYNRKQKDKNLNEQIIFEPAP
jgi:peptidoglycan/LPS O-acetylase OafA/YrhL